MKPHAPSALTAPSAARRFRALAALAPSLPAAYAVRNLLATDPSASVRAGALAWLARSPFGRVAAGRVVEALDDADPGVRAAAARALGAHRDIAAEDALAAGALSDRVWWVRRACLLAAAKRDPAGAVSVLVKALDDPFWRVRHAALAVLEAMGLADGVVRTEALCEPVGVTAAGSAARTWLAARWRGDVLPLPTPDPTPAPQGDARLDDPDPAVVAARAEALDPASVPAATWVLYLGDPHASLRRVAVRRLRAVRDPAVLGAVARWLDDPRVPYGWEAAVAVLDAQPEATLGPLRQRVLDVGTPAAKVWALASASRRAVVLDPTVVARCASHAAAAVRAATAEHLRASGDFDGLGRLVGDGDASVVRAAVEALVAGDAHPAVEPLLVQAMASGCDARARRQVARWALATGAQAWLARLGRDDDGEVRATALLGRVRAGDLDPAARAEAFGDPDPWVRAAAVDGATAAEVFARDPDVVVRRAAWRALRDPDAALRAEASVASDPWLRAASWRGATLDSADTLRAALAASNDRAEAVRRAVRGALEATEGLDARLDALLATTRDPAVVVPALTWRLRGDDAATRLVQAWHDATGPEAAPLRQHLATVALTLDDPRAVSLAEGFVWPAATARTEALRATPARRALGTTGIHLAPWVLSGAHELSEAGVARAWRAGVDTFFWEPGYRALRHWLVRRGARAQVVTGSYEASPGAIRRDVERALRALGRERLEVFLLFWVRSSARLSAEALGCLEDLKREGKVGAVGFSTHHRALAAEALATQPWDAVMLRHSAAHPAAESEVFPVARAHGRGVLAFSAMSYGRLVRRAPGDASDGPLPTAADCYRFALRDPVVAGCIAAPRTIKELDESLAALHAPGLDAEAEARLRAQGERVRAASRAFNAYVRMPQGAGLAVEDGRAVAAALLAGDDAEWARTG